MTETDDFLAHYGKKGMKWGKRKSKERYQTLGTGKRLSDSTRAKLGMRQSFQISRRDGKHEVKTINAAAQKRFDAAAKAAPNFKKEVRATVKGRGVTVKNPQLTYGKHSELILREDKGSFKNSKGEKISSDLGNAVLTKAGNIRRRRQTTANVLALTGTLAVSTLIATRKGPFK